MLFFIDNTEHNFPALDIEEGILLFFLAHDAQYSGIEFPKDCWHKSAKITNKFSLVCIALFVHFNCFLI